MKKWFLLLGLVTLLSGSSAFAQTSHSITLTWNYTQGTPAATTINVYRSTTSGTACVATPKPVASCYTKVGSVPVATTTYTDTTGVGGTTYFYVVTAVDAQGDESTISNEVTKTFLTNPQPPTNLTITSVN